MWKSIRKSIMKSFNEWMLEYNRFHDFMRKRDRALSRPELPTRKKNDKFSKISSFEQLKYLVRQNDGGNLKNTLRDIRSRGLFPEFFPFDAGSPGSGNIFAGFTDQQVKELEDANKTKLSGAGGLSKSPRSIEIDKRIQELKKKRAVAKIPLHVRVLVAASVEDENHDGWQQMSDSDWNTLNNQESPRYEELIKSFRAKGYLGPDAKEFDWFGHPMTKTSGMDWSELENYLIKQGYYRTTRNN